MKHLIVSNILCQAHDDIIGEVDCLAPNGFWSIACQFCGQRRAIDSTVVELSLQTLHNTPGLSAVGYAPKLGRHDGY